MAYAKELITIHGTNGGETGKAIRWVLSAEHYPNIHTTKLSHWFPFSQVEQIHPDTLVVNRWILETKGLYDAVINGEEY